MIVVPVLRIRIWCLFDPWIRNQGSGMGMKSVSGSGMNNPDHISERLVTIFWVKMLKFFDADPGWKKFGSDIQNLGWKKYGSRITITDPQYCFE